MVKNILIVNTHSTLNAGDAAIVLAQIRYLRKTLGPVDIALTSRTPELDRDIYGRERVEVWPPLLLAPSVHSGVGPQLRGSVKHLAAFRAKRDLRQAIRQADLVIASGGGYFWSNRRGLPGPMFMQNIMHLRTAARMGKPVLLFPQSFGPLFSGLHRRILRETLEADSVLKIFAREQESVDSLHQILRSPRARDKVELCPDMAFLLDVQPARAPAPQAGDGLSRPVLALTLRSWAFPGARGRKQQKERIERYLGEVAHFCEHIVTDWKGSVLVYPQARGPGRLEDDRLISRAFESKFRRDIPGAAIRYVEEEAVSSLDSAIAVLSGADLVLATRLHSAILALILGKPALAIGYQPKSAGTMELLGLGEQAFDIGQVEAAELLAAARRILAAPEAVRDRIRAGIARLKRDAEDKLDRALAPFRG